MRILIIIVFIVFGVENVFCQEETIIDPVFSLCYRLKNNAKIKPLNLGGKYQGELFVLADCDTINNVLINHQIVFVKLESYSNPNDSIEIRLDDKFGNFKFIEDNLIKIFGHFSSLRIEKTGYKNCKIPQFTLPIKIE
ncbi:hypothetical protein [Labilibaculum antarcticum]|uniref:Uncharacterized protein n=1 Tax=Labilibaculum antarcticum TaxID=1717717 RepID=A0A1Y1CDN0_9BACT|nr:hypothetical protein [Labilibaculum antarcticum]BAX78447.1 hypothetical protein ALGA_0052 [Labilibaculum antarcticum]